MKIKTVVALGDSITYGFPYTPNESWVEAMRRATGWSVVNAGIPGDTLLDMEERLERDVLRYEPQLVIVMGGTNDVYQGLSQLQLMNSFLRIMERLQERGSQIWVGLPLPVDDGIEGSLKIWREWLVSYTEREGIQLVEFFNDFVTAGGCIKEELLLDGCHPGLNGYEIMGQRIIRIIEENWAKI